MIRVGVPGAAGLPYGQRGDASLTDLAREAAEPLLARGKPDSLICALPTAATVEAQLNGAALVADRLGLRGDTLVLGMENGDASGAAALHPAFACLKSGMAKRTLVLGASKVSDQSEIARSELLDQLIDQECERALGLTYASVAGLMADLYLQRQGVASVPLAELVADNYAKACRGDETYLKAALSAAEIRRDLPLSSRLVRADTAPLLDGACALLVEGFERDDDAPRDARIEITHVASAIESVAVFERRNPTTLASLHAAIGRILRAGRLEFSDVAMLLVDNPLWLLEPLVLEGLPQSSRAQVNPDGGLLGRGQVFGASGLIQAYEAFIQLSGAAGARQCKPAPAPGAHALAIAPRGLGTQAVVTPFKGRPLRPPPPGAPERPRRSAPPRAAAPPAR